MMKVFQIRNESQQFRLCLLPNIDFKMAKLHVVLYITTTQSRLHDFSNNTLKFTIEQGEERRRCRRPKFLAASKQVDRYKTGHK